MEEKELKKEEKCHHGNNSNDCNLCKKEIWEKVEGAPYKEEGVDISLMKSYTGTKTVKAMPISRENYLKYRGWDLPEGENPKDELYLVEYEADPQSKPNHANHKGYVTMSPKHVFDKAYVENNTESADKSLMNTTASQAKDNVGDIEFWGDGDTFKLISKASSKAEGWMKSTKAMSITGAGCVIQVTTQQGDNVAEALTFVPGARISEVTDKNGKVLSRKVEIAGY